MKLYPSSSGFMWGDMVLTEYDSACLRSILIKSRGVRTADISKVNQEVGAAHEDRHAEEVKDKLAARELPIVREVIEGVTYSGRCDFLLQYDGFQVVHETKASVSKSTRDSVIRKGKYKLNHLAQLVSYLIELKLTRGKIVVGYYEVDADGRYVWQEGREFRVEIDEKGAIFVDGKRSGYNVADQLTHRYRAAEVIKEGIIWGRPEGAEAKFGSPCSFCAFKSTCDLYDSGQIDSLDEFIASASEDAAAYVPKEVTPNKVKETA